MTSFPADAESPDTEPEADNTERSITLTDGVVAIALTLLALDLKPDLPRSASSHDLAHYLDNHAGQYLAFLLAFVLIAQYWLVHHRVMRTVRKASPALHRFTFLFLFGITVAPLTTYVTGNYGSALATTLFAANIALLSLALAAIAETVHRQRLDDRVEAPLERHRRWARAATTVLIPGAVAALAWAFGGNAAWLYLLFFAAEVPGRIATRRRAATATGN